MISLSFSIYTPDISNCGCVLSPTARNQRHTNSTINPSRLDLESLAKKEQKKCKQCYNLLFARNLEIPCQARNDVRIVRIVKSKDNLLITKDLSIPLSVTLRNSKGLFLLLHLLPRSSYVWSPTARNQRHTNSTINPSRLDLESLAKKEQKKCKHCYNLLFARNLEFA